VRIHDLRIWARWLLTLGVVFVLPSAIVLTTADPPFTLKDDLQLGFSPVLQLPLESLRSGQAIRVSYVVPSSSQWDRIRRLQSHHGGGGYIALIADRLRGQALYFSSLEIEFSVLNHNADVALTPAGGAFLYEAFGGNIGFRFAVTSGDKLQFVVKARRPDRLPDAELLVQPYWDSTVKDTAEYGPDIDAMFKPVVTRAAQIGLMLLAAGAAVRAVAAISEPGRSG